MTVLTDGTGFSVELVGDRLGPGTGRHGRPTTPGLEPMRFLPGFIDVQVNGAFGIDLQAEPDRLGELAARLPEVGVTSWCPTLVTGPPDRLATARSAWKCRPGESDGDVTADAIGWHLEGPCLSPERLGAHPARWRRDPADADTSRWTPDDGVCLVTLAPERPGATELIRRLVASGVTVSLGHTDAGTEEMRAGVAAGATMVTHLGNAMRPFHHRDPGPIGVALTESSLAVGLIADGVHVHPATVALAFGSAGDRVVLVSDAVAPAGTPGTDGHGHRLGDGTLAGATALLDRVLAGAIGEVAFDDLVRAATAAPARLLGLADRGHLAPGLRADVVVWDESGEPGDTVVRTWVAGRAHRPAGRPFRTVSGLD